MCQPWSVTKTPVCVLGLGLIGGSVMRAAAAAGREVFGYNRSVEAVQAATVDGFDATENLDEALARAADSEALIVLAVPMPALPHHARPHPRHRAPDCPLTDVISVKGAVLDEVESAGLLDRFVGGHPMAGTAHSGWAAGNARLFVGAPWVVSVDDHVDAGVWAMVMELALDCGAVVVPARSDEHDAAAAAISHLPHLLAEALADHRGRGAAGLRAGRGVVPGRHPGGGHRAGSGAGHVRGQLRPAAARPGADASSC